MRHSEYTIKKLLDELKEGLPNFKIGMIFETSQTIFPDNKIIREKKNIKINGSELTKPLACSRKEKEKYIKEESPLMFFFRETKRGDFLKVLFIENDIAFCENLSLKEDIAEKYYSDEMVPITYDDMLNGVVRIYRRKVDKFFGGNNG